MESVDKISTRVNQERRVLCAGLSLKYQRGVGRPFMNLSRPPSAQVICTCS